MHLSLSTELGWNGSKALKSPPFANSKNTFERHLPNTLRKKTPPRWVAFLYGTAIYLAQCLLDRDHDLVNGAGKASLLRTHANVVSHWGLVIKTHIGGFIR